MLIYPNMIQQNMKERKYEEKINVNVPKWMYEWLKKRAEEEDLTMSDIVRKAIREYIRKHAKRDQQ